MPKSEPSASPTDAVASALIAPWLRGPPRVGTTICTGPHARYLAIEGEVIAVVRSSAIRLPNAVVVAELPTADPSAPVSVGDGEVRVGSWCATIRRWFDPRVRIARVSPRAVAALRDAVDARSPGDPLLDRDAVPALAAALAAQERHRAAVTALLGRGGGSTPAGDDLLAGVLAGLRASASPKAEPFASVVCALAPSRTTPLSASLLRAADRGAVIPEAGAVLRALEDEHAVVAAASQLCAVGHSSGWFLATGLSLALTVGATS